MTKAIHNQNLLDIAVQEYGTAAAAFDVALANGMAVSDLPTTGQGLAIPEASSVADIQTYYRNRSIHPATAASLLATDTEPRPEGISFWAIATEFLIGG